MRGIKHALTERYYAWEEAKEIVERDGLLEYREYEPNASDLQNDVYIEKSEETSPMTWAEEEIAKEERGERGREMTRAKSTC